MKKIFLSFLPILLISSGCGIPSQMTTSTNNTGTQQSAGNKVDLSNKNLSNVPMNIFETDSIEELDLSNNNLTGALPAEIRKLKRLKKLNISNNNMTGLPAELGQLTNLEWLDASNNELTGLPYELGNLKKLREFNLSGNNYSEQDLSRIRKDLPQTNFILK